MVEASETARTIQEVLGMDADAVESLPVERVVDRIEQELATADVDGVTVDADGASGRVVFSRYLLTGVVELVDNAIEHAADPTVTVELREDDAGATIAVADDGPGLPRSQWDLLMGDREITQLQHSEGLGLWLVKWLTDRHGGQLRLVRADETGTTVAIDLPERLPDGTA
jgi:signal transduction histidine kinase